ncbi:MAG: SusD-like protein P25 [Bacteroides rodentium]
MKLKNILLCASVLGGMTLASCTGNFLDEDRNPNKLGPSTFWKTEADILKGLTACYAGLQPSASWGKPYERYIVIDNYRSDELKHRNDVTEWTQLAQYQNESTNYVANDEWFNLYRSINFCNQCLDNIPNVPDDGSQNIIDAKKTSIAEARFLRAFFYYRLFINFGEKVPMPLHQLQGVESEFYPDQAQVGEVKALIETELSECQRDLPESWSADMAGRATKYAAAALLGKYYMFIGETAKAKAEFWKVIDSHKYDLIANYGDNFDGRHENNKESILEVQFSGKQAGDQYEYNLFALHLLPSVYKGSYEEAYPSEWLYNTLKQDLTVDGKYSDRLYNTIIFNDPQSRPFYYEEGKSFDDYHAQYDKDENRMSDPIYWYKFTNVNADLDDYWNESGTNVPLIRYADVLLLYAECLNDEGLTKDAIGYINQVRNRVHVTPLPETMTKDQVLKHLQDVERPCELALEGSRWYDLLRWGILKKTLVDHGKPFAENLDETKHIKLAIPHAEFLMNPGWEQNEGYGK